MKEFQRQEGQALRCCPVFGPRVALNIPPKERNELGTSFTPPSDLDAVVRISFALFRVANRRRSANRGPPTSRPKEEHCGHEDPPRDRDGMID